MKLFSATLFLLLSTAAQAEVARKLNLGLPMDSARLAVSGSEVEISGSNYLRFESAKGAILVPKAEGYDMGRFDLAFCASKLKGAEPKTVIASLGERTRIHAELIRSTIAQRCVPERKAKANE